MCGFVGFYSPNLTWIPEIATLQAGLTAISSRGPDDASILYRPEEGLGLGFNRLSILDLSKAGSQPRVDVLGHALVFNGEIYNFLRFKDLLTKDGVQFQGHSDSEVLFEALKSKKFSFPEDLEGMFSYSYIDTRARTVWLARDRAGEKPLFYALIRGTLVFGSTARAVKRLLPSLSISSEAAISLLVHDTIGSENSMYQEIKKVPPGHQLQFSGGDIILRRYWSFSPDLQDFQNESDLVSRCEELLDSSVRDELMADVPIGVLLSGGIDSTLITKFMSRYRPDLHSFSIGFSLASFDESIYAQHAAAILGTIHHHETIDSASFVRDFYASIAGLDEPLGDPSYFATWSVCRLARRYVTVALSGDGADELFLGYPTLQLERYGTVWSRVLPKVPEFLVHFLRRRSTSSEYMSLSYKAAQFLQGIGWDPWERQQKWIQGSSPQGLRTSLQPKHFQSKRESHWQDAQRFYFENYLPLSILTKSDRASMAHGLELRAPFLHPRMIKLAESIHWKAKLQKGQTKWPLRQMLKQYPELAKLSARKKHGFAIPVVSWFSVPQVANMVGEMLDSQSSFFKEILDGFDVMKFWQSQSREGIRYGKWLYNALVLATWKSTERV